VHYEPACLDQVRVVEQQIVRVADGEDGGNNFQVQVRGRLFQDGQVIEVVGIHRSQAAELGIVQHYVRVAGGRGALHESDDVGDVLVHPKVLRDVKPAFQRRRFGQVEGDEEENQVRNQESPFHDLIEVRRWEIEDGKRRSSIF
jgi:hypothetical protein